MKDNFDIILLDEAIEFIENQNQKVQKKIVYNLQKAKKVIDPKIFKKLNDKIWEFRTSFSGQQFRLLAFWDPSQNSFVVCTHGFKKKTQKTPKAQIEKAENIRTEYLKNIES